MTARGKTQQYDQDFTKKKVRSRPSEINWNFAIDASRTPDSNLGMYLELQKS